MSDSIRLGKGRIRTRYTRGVTDPPRPSRRAEQVEATRLALVAAARTRFGRDGFAATSVDDVAADAGVTIGALYHHFGTKAGLFETVFEQVQVELLEGAMTAAAAVGPSPLAMLRKAFSAFLDAVLQPDVQQIVLVDGPAVLGLARYTEIDERYSYAGVRDTLQAAADASEITAFDIDTMAHVLLGACTQGGLLIARSPHQRKARRAVGRTIDELLDGLAR